MFWTVLLYLLAGIGILCLGFLGAAGALNLRDHLRKERRREAMRKAALAKRLPAPAINPKFRPASSTQVQRTRHRPPSSQRKPANPNLPRVMCNYCLKQITLTNAGALRSHGGTPTGMGYTRDTCRGSGKKYVDYVIHEDPI